MRPPRIIILAFFTSAFLFLLSRAWIKSEDETATSRYYPSRAQPHKSVLGLFYYNTPFSLFPPNAAISLTDDNSTSFAARPAAFGPKLAPSGLSGQLWVGSGFFDDGIDGIGELGCSDIPGWDDGNTRSVYRHPVHAESPGKGDSQTSTSLPRRGDAEQMLDPDGTDGHLHQEPRRREKHADIQSIQEGAEIEGKIVLLMRGGCGFLEKIMWAQRRGAIGVIVGDNQRGGPLIQMFAHGEEVENVTIASVFTARTSAQLLSALTQPGSFIEDALNDDGTPVRKVGTRPGRDTESPKTSPASARAKKSRGWWSRIFGRGRLSISLDRKRPAGDKDKAGIVTPKSGEYRAEGLKDESAVSRLYARASAISAKGGGILSKLFGGDDDDDDDESTVGGNGYIPGEDDEDNPPQGNPPSLPHDGLWVTITPTSSASPFFDTLLVLVISPLVTLSIVYALLILRARIRRRRWRAPKSVVERLPVRTYHTVTRSPSLSPRLPSPSSSSPTTPLLQQSPTRTRPRSRTTTGLPAREGLVAPSMGVLAPGPSSRRRPEHGFSAEWRKYMGRQVECVVCLEEYVDGVSRVMRLPCGHEFHADCITPWLTTRRRTCPICKGDVVRSMARGSGSWAVPRYEPYHDDGDDDDIEAEAEAEVDGLGYQSTSGSGSGSGSGSSDSSDLEQGPPEAESSDRRRWREGWLGIFSNGLGGRPWRSPSPRSSSPSGQGRNR